MGRPNVGKSSLLNRLLGEERVLVSEIPGTTRDSVDTLLALGTHSVRLIDTAGIRRKGRTDQGPEVLSVLMARRAIERAEVCLLVVDAKEGLTAQDTHVAGYIDEAGRGVVVAVTKADLIADEGQGRQGAGQGPGPAPPQVPQGHAAALRVLAHRRRRAAPPAGRPRSGRGVPPPHRHRRAEPDPARRLGEAAAAGGKRPPRLLYATQTGSGPPRFVLFVSGTGKLHFSYVRYLENALREAFPLAGVPIRFKIQGKSGRTG